MVVEEEKSIIKAAKKLRIKLPTARLIVKKFKLTGEFTVKKQERMSLSLDSERKSSEISQNSEEQEKNRGERIQN